MAMASTVRCRKTDPGASPAAPHAKLVTPDILVTPPPRSRSRRWRSLATSTRVMMSCELGRASSRASVSGPTLPLFLPLAGDPVMTCRL